MLFGRKFIDSDTQVLYSEPDNQRQRNEQLSALTCY